MNRKIFIGDDDHRVLEAYRSLFEVENDSLNFFKSDRSLDGYEVEYFSSGEALLVRLQEYIKEGLHIPLCILDVMMPGRSGVDIAVEIRKIDPDTQILIVTAYSDTSVKEIQKKLLNKVFFQRKPFHGDELISQVETLIQLWNQIQETRNKNRALKIKEEILSEQAQVIKHQYQVIESVLRGVNDVIFEVDQQGKFLHVWHENDQVLAMSPKYFLGKKILDVFPKEKSELFMDIILKALSHKKSLCFKYDLDFPTQKRYFEAKVRPLSSGHSVLILVDEIKFE